MKPANTEPLYRIRRRKPEGSGRPPLPPLPPSTQVSMFDDWLPMAPPATRDECVPCATCQEYIDLVKSFTRDYNPAIGLSRSKWIDAQPTTTLECGHLPKSAIDHCRPCTRTACTMHLDTDTEPAGKPHNGKRPPIGVRRRRADDKSPSCARDIEESVADGIETADIATLLDTGQRRVQQLTVRAVSKREVAKQIIEAMEAFAESKLSPFGFDVAYLWGCFAEQLDDGSVAIRARRNDADVVYVTIAVDVSRLDAKEIP